MGYAKDIWHTVATDDKHLETAEDAKKDKVKGFDDKDKHGNTPLHITVFEHQFYMFKFFLEMGAGVNKGDEDGETALMSICNSSTIDIKFLKEILKYKPDFTIKNNNNQDAMDMAKINGRKDFIKILEKQENKKKLGRFAKLMRD